MTTIIQPNPTEEEAAAILAAVAMYSVEEEQPPQQDGDWRWLASGILVNQGLPLMRSPLRPQWGNVERLRRAGHGGAGIVGL